MPVILDGLTDDELKKEAKNESKNDAISAIIKAAKCLVSRVPNEEEMVKSLEIFRLKMILRYANYIVMLSLFCAVGDCKTVARDGNCTAYFECSTHVVASHLSGNVLRLHDGPSVGQAIDYPDLRCFMVTLKSFHAKSGTVPDMRP